MTDEHRTSKFEIRNAKFETELPALIIEEQSTIDNRQSSIIEASQPEVVGPELSVTLPLLLEVGCEEIPARFLREAEKGLGERVLAALDGAGLLPLDATSPGSGVVGAVREPPLQTYSTPRRLAVHVPVVLAQQPDKVDEVLGPPVKVAIDAEGKYTRAAESFAQKNSARVEDLARTTTPKGEYLSLRKTTPGRPALEILAEILPGAILGLTFPKSMYWMEKSAPRFVRPIRWIVAILGEGKIATTVNFDILGVKSGNFTFGHRAKSGKALIVNGLQGLPEETCQRASRD